MEVQPQVIQKRIEEMEKQNPPASSVETEVPIPQPTDPENPNQEPVESAIVVEPTADFEILPQQPAPVTVPSS